MTHFRFILCTLLLGHTACFALNRADLLAEDSAVKIHISNMQAVKDALLKTPFGRLCQDEQFISFLNLPVTNLFQEISADDSPSTKQFKMITGEMAASLSLPDETMFFAVELSPEEYTQYCLLQDQIVEEDEMTRKNHSFQDVPLTEEIAQDGEESIWRAYYQNTVLEGTSREQVEKSIMVLKTAKPEASGAAQPFCKISCSSPAALIIQAVEESKKEKPGRAQSPNIEALLNAAGISSINRVELTSAFNEKETRIDFEVQGDDLNRGLFAMVNSAPVKLPAAAFIPKDLFYFNAAQPDIAGIWNELQKMLLAASPMAGFSFAQFPAMLLQLCEVDFQQDILNTFGSTALSYSAPGADESRTGMALELKDGTVLQNTLNKILSAPSFAEQSAVIRQETFRDVTLYEFDNAKTGQTTAFSILPNYLFYGTDENVRAMIRSVQVPAEGENYLDNALIRELISRAPRSACALRAISGKEYAAAVVDELQKPQYQRLFVREDWEADFTKLPSAQHIGGFFGNTFGWSEASATKRSTTLLIQN